MVDTGIDREVGVAQRRRAGRQVGDRVDAPSGIDDIVGVTVEGPDRHIPETAPRRLPRWTALTGDRDHGGDLTTPVLGDVLPRSGSAAAQTGQVDTIRIDVVTGDRVRQKVVNLRRSEADRAVLGMAQVMLDLHRARTAVRDTVTRRVVLHLLRVQMLWGQNNKGP